MPLVGSAVLSGGESEGAQPGTSEIRRESDMDIRIANVDCQEHDRSSPSLGNAVVAGPPFHVARIICRVDPARLRLALFPPTTENDECPKSLSESLFCTRSS